MATHGAADSYYNAGSDPAKEDYPPQPQMQYPPQAANNGYQGAPQYQQPPPNYNQNYQNPRPPPMTSADGKQTFDQTFKLDKPKYNDLWAGILVSRCPQLLSIDND